jgi:hypothetical protein
VSKRDIKDRLETIRICTDGSVETVIAYWLIERVAEHLLKVAPGLFWRPYYNTPLVPMLRAHADTEVIRIHAFLCGWALCKGCRAVGKKKLATCSTELCGKPLTDGLSLRGLEDLKNHRDVAGHPLTWHLDRAGVRKFVDTKRDRFDVRPALLWDIHRSIVDAQIAAGAPASVLDVTISPYRTGVVHSILSLCMRPGLPPFDETALVESMTKLWMKARGQFEKHPDGQFPRPTDAELDATFGKFKKAWEDSR